MRRMADGFAAHDDAPVFVAANRLALEAFRGGERDLATEICQLEIRYAAAKLADGGVQAALLGLQPVINLIRLNGYAGDFGLAWRGLAGLEAIADGQATCIAGFSLGPGQPVAVRALARNNCLVETPKILWRRNRGDDMVASGRRLLAKWPRSAVSGPLHSAEAPWLTGAEDAMRAAGLPAPPALRRLCALHALEQAVPGSEALAGELFASRAEALAKPPAAAARDLTCLGRALAGLGRPADATACLALAQATAGPADPALANRIRREWLEITSDPSALPPELDASRLTGPQLRAAGELAAARLGPSGSRGPR